MRTAKIDPKRCRQLMAEGMTGEGLAKELGVSVHSAAVARDVITLADEDELTTAEWATVTEAMRMITAGTPEKTRALIEPLMVIRFGPSEQRRGRGPVVSRELATTAFRSSAIALSDAMGMAEEVRVPWLPLKDRVEIVKELNKGVKVVRALIAVTNNGGHNVPTDT